MPRVQRLLLLVFLVLFTFFSPFLDTASKRWLNEIVSIVCKNVNDNHHSGISAHETWNIEYCSSSIEWKEWRTQKEKNWSKISHFSIFLNGLKPSCINRLAMGKTGNFTQRTIIINGLFHYFFFPAIFQFFV